MSNPGRISLTYLPRTRKFQNTSMKHYIVFMVFLLATFFCLLPLKSLHAADEITNLLTGGAAEETAPVPDKVITTESSSQDDAKMRKRLREIFMELDTLRGVKISVNKGVVTLSGEVDSRATESRAIQFAQQVEGVVEVVNKMTINRSLTKRLDNTLEKLSAIGKELLASLPLYLLALLVLAVFWLLGRWISGLKGLYRRFSPNYFIASLLGQIIHLVFIMMGLILALVLLDATALIGTILGAAGIVGLAVGFAVRDTVENYIASILLSLRNPFAMNDFVNIDGHEGNVLRLTSRATILISADGNHIRLPNAMVFKAVITNFTRHPERRFQFDVGVDSEQNLLAAQALALETLQTTDGVLTDPPPMVIIEQLGDSNVQLRIFGWVDQEQANFQKVRSEAIRSVKTAFDQAGIVMPEPIYNLRIKQQQMEATDSQTRTPTGPKVSIDTENKVHDVSPDRTLEKRVEEEQAQDNGLNLLTDQAPKEI